MARLDRRRRHSEKLRGLLVLGDHGAPHLLDGPDAERSVAAGSGQDHGDRPLFVARRHRLEEQVRAWSDEMHQFRVRKREASIAIDQKVAIGRRDVDPARPDPVAFGGLHHLERRAPAENLGHQAAMARIEMLDDDDRRRKAGGQALQDMADGRDATGGRGQGDHVELRAGKVPGRLRRVDIPRLLRP